jgi:outer membrane protein assembly factor BamB
VRLLVVVGLSVVSASALAADWPQWAGGSERNMVSPETGVARDFGAGERSPETGHIDPKTTSGVRWVVPLGSQTYGNPTVSQGKVFVGTNNDAQYRAGVDGDHSVVLAFSETDGSFLWQYTAPKLGAGKVNDWEYLGICSSPAVVGDAVYFVSSTGEVVALDIDGQVDGNDGLQDEAQTFVGAGKPPLTIGHQDADVLWRFDMRKELGVFPHNVTSSSVLVVGERIYVTTSNGTDWSHLNVPSPYSPSLIVLDRETGALIGEEASGISARTMHSNWSSPGYAPVGDDGLVLFGGGDGYLYGFEPAPVEVDGLPTLREKWRLDANAASYRTKDGQPITYATAPGPSEIIATPVTVDGVVYVSIGQDPEHGPGVGRLTAMDPTQEGDVTDSATLWTYDGISRSISTVAVSAGIVFAADYEGRLHAVHQKTGKPLWVHDTNAHMWGSPFVVDGRVYIGNEDGMLSVLKVSKRKKILAEIPLTAPMYTTPVVANQTLYIATQNHLYAVGGTP